MPCKDSIIHQLRMWYNYLRCLYSFLKIEVYLCFKFDLREAFDIRSFLKETRSALKLRFDCSVVRLSCVNLHHRKYNLMVCQKWIDFTLHFTLIHFSVNIWNTLIWTHRWLYELIDHLIWAHPCALRAYRMSECVC